MKNFTIANLMTGDLVTLRNGKTGTVMLDTKIGDIIRYHSEKNSFSYIAKRFNADLTHNKHTNMDIMKVYRIDPTKVPMNKVGDLVANPEKMLDAGTVVFDRDAVPAKPKLGDLITGDLLIHRNGKVSTVYKDTPIGDIIRYYTENNSFSYLRRYDDDLVHESKDSFDIVAVLRVPDSIDSTQIGDYIANPVKVLTADNVGDYIVWSDGDIQASFYYDGDGYRTSFSADYLSSTSSDSDDSSVSSDDSFVIDHLIRDILGINLSDDSDDGCHCGCSGCQSDDDNDDDRADEIEELRDLLDEIADRLDNLS